MRRHDTLVIGKGFLGSRIHETFGCRSTDAKIYSFRDADRLLVRHRPKVLINCVGFTGGQNIDGCEEDKERTLIANTYVPILLAEACLRRGVKLVHLSTGCIFHFDYAKDLPIDERKAPDFLELFYSRSKIYSERALEALARRFGFLIVRIRVPLDDRPHPRNILTKLIQFKKVIDLENSVTYVPDFLKALEHLIAIKAEGIYNVATRGGLRYPELLEAYRRCKPDFSYEVIDYKKLRLVRTNLLLSTKKLEKTGFAVRSIREVLKECVEHYVRY